MNTLCTHPNIHTRLLMGRDIIVHVECPECKIEIYVKQEEYEHLTREDILAKMNAFKPMQAFFSQA